MTPKLLSVVVSSHNRADLLDRALATYARQTLPAESWEYVLADNFSTDHTKEVVAKWQALGVPIRRIDVETDLRKTEMPNDGAAPRNGASLFATGAYIVSTHPEILVPPYGLQAMLEAMDNAPPWSWVTAIPYWLPKVDDSWWGGWDGSRDQLAALSGMPGFYDPSWPKPVDGPIDYRNNNQEVRLDWESEVFWGMAMGLWRWLGGFREFDVWGSVDVDFHHRRRIANIGTVVAKTRLSPHRRQALMVYHPHHDSPRDMDRCMDALTAAGPYKDLEDMRSKGGIIGDFHHGHRERALTMGSTDGIMPDHLHRYEWAAQFVRGKTVLDVPCGTGYGLVPLRAGGFASYVGMDIDSESIAWASKYAKGVPNAAFLVEDMTSPDAWFTGSDFEVICCFEGLEHVPNAGEVLRRLFLSLAEGGVLLVSTPQKGATPGTPFDRHMMTAAEFQALVAQLPGAVSAQLFYQERYGLSEVREGPPPADAEIQIVKITRGA